MQTKRTNTASWMERQQRWQIKVQCDGIRKTFYSTTPGRSGQREANAKADKWLQDQISPSGIKADKAIEDFLKLEETRVSHSQYVKLESISRLYISPVIAKKKIDRVTFDDYQTVIDEAISKGLARKSVSNIRSVINQFAKYCRRKKYSDLRVDDLDLSHATKKVPRRILQPSSIMSLFSIDTTSLNGRRVYDKYINAYRLAVATGMRPGEIIGLKWGDIEDNIIRLQRSINIYGQETSGKNENAVRAVPMTKITSIILEDQKASTENHAYADYVFEIASESTFRHRWKQYCISNDIPYVSLYELRHTFVSISSAIPEGQLKQIIGHSKNMDTFGVYGHLVDGQLQDTANRIDAVFSGILSSEK